MRRYSSGERRGWHADGRQALNRMDFVMDLPRTEAASSRAVWAWPMGSDRLVASLSGRRGALPTATAAW